MRTFRSEKYLSLPKEDASYTEINDIGEVAPDSITIEDVKVVAATYHYMLQCMQ